MKKKNKDTLKKFRRDIIIGLITSAIWGVLIWIVKSVPKAGKSFFGTIQNLIYSSAARISSDSLLSFIVIMGLSFLVVFTILPFIIRASNQKFEKELEDYEKKIDTLNIKIEEYENELPLNKEKIESCLKEIEKTNNEFLNADSNEKKNRKISKIPLFFITFYLIFIAITTIIPIYVLNDFNYDIKMIKPYTDNKTVMMLESDWTRMRSKDDYDKIYETINRIKEENNLTKK